MEEIRDLKSLEEDLLWEVEINASIAELANNLIMPNTISEISSIILKQLIFITKSKYCFAGYFDTDSKNAHYIINVDGDNDQTFFSRFNDQSMKMTHLHAYLGHLYLFCTFHA